MELEKHLQTSVLGSVLGSGPLAAMSNKVVVDTEAEKAVRKTWAGVLKDCHKCDPQGLGCVSREDFLMALSNGTTHPLNRILLSHTLSIVFYDTPS